MEGKNFDGSISVDISKLVSNKDESYDWSLPRVVHSINFPDSFDARTFWAECPAIGKIYDQRNGPPSWIYAAVGRIADSLCIKYGVQIDVETTVERMVRANGGFNGTYNSADIVKALNYRSKKGIHTVKLMNNTDCLPHSQCETKEIQFDKHFKVYAVSPDYVFDKIRDIMVNGPMAIQLRVHSDFPSYESGIFQRISDKFLGTHVIKLIGWGFEDDYRYYLATNSWGINGLFKLRLGANQLDSHLPAISPLFETKDYVTSIPEQSQVFDLY